MIRPCRRDDCNRVGIKRTAVGAYETILCGPHHAELEHAAERFGGYSQVRGPGPAAWGWRLTEQPAMAES